MTDDRGNGRPLDTDAATDEAYVAMLASLSPEERGRRVFQLSEAMRRVTWAGAMDAVGHLGTAAVRERYLRQLHGDAIADHVLQALSIDPQ